MFAICKKKTHGLSIVWLSQPKKKGANVLQHPLLRTTLQGIQDVGWLYVHSRNNENTRVNQIP